MQKDKNKIRTYPLSDNCPEWLFRYVTNHEIFDQFLRVISPEIEHWAKLKPRERVRYVTEICKAQGIKDIRNDRGRLCIMIELTPDLILAALKQ